MGNDKCFRGRRLAGVDDAVANGISRWEPHSDVPANLQRPYPNVDWHEQALIPSVLAECSRVLVSSTSEDHLRSRPDGPMEQPPRAWRRNTRVS